MDVQLKAKWVKALRSGEYEQERGALYISRAGKTTYCCIGVGYVACVQPEITYGDETYEAAYDLGLGNEATETLIELNDRDKKSFSEIADWIEANL